MTLGHHVSFLEGGRLNYINAFFNNFLVTCCIKLFLKLANDPELVYMIEIC